MSLPGDSETERIARAELIMRLRRRNVAGTRVLSALERTPRALFLDAPHKGLAYADRPAPIDCGQTISQPTIVATMTEALMLEAHHRVLEIGTGSGYQCAILAQLVSAVYSIERHPRLLAAARERLAVLGFDNVFLRVDDGHKGWPEEAPFDRILLTAAAEAVPQALVDQLAVDGVLVAPVGTEGSVQDLLRCRKTPNGLEGEHLADVAFVPMRPGVGNH